MEAAEHFVASLLLAFLFLILEPFPSVPITYLGFGIICGTLIDLDHFLASRIRNGNWHHLRNALKSPIAIFTDYRVSKESSEDSYFGSINQIYVTHILIEGPYIFHSVFHRSKNRVNRSSVPKPTCTNGPNGPTSAI